MSSKAVTVGFDLYVDTGEQVSAQEFHDRATALMDQLMALDECNADIADPTVSSDAGRSVLSVEIIVFTGDPIDALQKSSALLHTALHAAGAHTPDWPIVRTENRTREAGYLADA